MIAIGFFAVESSALHVEVRRQEHSLSLAAFPLVLGLLSLSPPVLVLSRLLGGGLALVIIKRRTGLKLAWTLALFAAETSVAAAIASFALADGRIGGMSDWVTLLIALLVADLMRLVAVPIVIMIYEGGFRRSGFAQIGRGQTIAAVSASYSVVAAIAIVSDPRVLVIALMPMLAVAALLKIHDRLGREHDDLRKLHGFSEAIADRHPLERGLEELTNALHARGAALAVTRPEGGYTVSALIDDRYAPRVLVNRVLSAPEPTDELSTVIEADADPDGNTVASLIAQLGGDHGLGISVVDSSLELAILVVFDRLGDGRSFPADHHQLFSSLSSTLGARLAADRLMERLERQVAVDHLTQLSNRNALEEALDERLADLRQPGALVVLDLDRFKDVNDSLGHQLGDKMLRAVAARLSGLLGPADMAARLGGDEFAVLLDRVASAEELETRIDALMDHVGRPLELDGIALDLGISVGVASWPSDAQTSTDLLRLADIAMYEAKRTHQLWVRYAPTIGHTSPNGLRLMGELRDAIAGGELAIHLQPQVRSRDLELVGAEALVRWNHPRLGMVPPADFLPMAEHSAVARDLTDFVLGATLDAAVELGALGVAISCSVNLTTRDVLDRHLPDRVARALTERGLPGSVLTLEVTEHSLIVDIDEAIRNLAALRALGCRTSADDFGTGYASLRYLQRLPLDEVKIDRSFVAGVAGNVHDEAIVRSTTRLLKDLGLTVVAEGVEDLPTLKLIREIGCDIVQGYLVSRPVPVPHFTSLAARSDLIVEADLLELTVASQHSFGRL